MNCAEFEVLLHALIDGELDAGHARDVEAHVATCSACAEKLASFRAMREAMSGAALKEPHRRICARASRAALRGPDGARHLDAWLFQTDATVVLRRICSGLRAFCSGCGKPRAYGHPRQSGARRSPTK